MKMVTSDDAADVFAAFDEAEKEIDTFFKDEMPAGAFTYVYGGKTAAKVQSGGKPGRAPGGKGPGRGNDQFSGQIDNVFLTIS